MTPHHPVVHPEKTKAPDTSANWCESRHQGSETTCDVTALLPGQQESIRRARKPESAPAAPHMAQDAIQAALFDVSAESEQPSPIQHTEGAVLTITSESVDVTEIRRTLRRSGRPQNGIQTVFKESDGAQVGPGATAQNLAYDGVVDSSGLRDPSHGQAAGAHRGTQIERQPSRRLGADVIAGDLGPGNGVLVRLGAGRTGHVPRVPTRQGGRGAKSQYTTDGVSNHHTYWQVEVYTSKYRPNIPDQHWAIIGEFTRRAVLDAAAYIPYRYERALSDVCMHVYWCWATAGLPLERSIIFHRDTIEEHTRSGCLHLTDASRGNRRSTLLSVARALLPPGEAVTRLSPLCKAGPSAPYTAQEIVALRTWANGQNTSRRRRDGRTLLALGLGAGLAASEMRELRVGDITADSEGVLVQVRGKRERLVPVLETWEAPLLHLLDHAPADRLAFGVERTRPASRNAITNYVQRSRGIGLKPQTQRMRGTWIVNHLIWGTPIDHLSAASGLASAEMVNRFRQFIPDRQDTPEHRRVLRHQSTTLGRGRQP